MRRLVEKGRQERARRPAPISRCSCLTLNRASKQLPFRVQPVLQGPAFLPSPLLIQFVGALRNAALMRLSTPCGLFSGACILTARTGVRRGARQCRRGSADGGFLAQRFPSPASAFVVVDSARGYVGRR